MPQQPLPPNQPIAPGEVITIENPYQKQGQVQYVTPNDNNVNSNTDSESNSTAVNSNTLAPNIYGQSANSNVQVNSGYGDHTEECMTNVGCQSTVHVDFVGYYNRSDFTNEIDTLTNAYSDTNNYGAAVRLVVPLGNGFSGNLEKKAEAEVTRALIENKRLNQDLIERGVELHDKMVQMCANVKNTVNGKKIVLSPTPNGNTVSDYLLYQCQGVNIAMHQQNDDIKALIEENRRLRQKIDQFQRQGISQRVGN